jgi:hypothetical protein
LRLGPTVYKVWSFRLMDSSVTSVTLQSAILGGGRIPPLWLGDAGHNTADGPEGRTVSRGSTNLVGPIAGFCGLPTRDGIGPDQLKRTDPEK